MLYYRNRRRRLLGRLNPTSPTFGPTEPTPPNLGLGFASVSRLAAPVSAFGSCDDDEREHHREERNPRHLSAALGSVPRCCLAEKNLLLSVCQVHQVALLFRRLGLLALLSSARPVGATRLASRMYFIPHSEQFVNRLFLEPTLDNSATMWYSIGTERRGCSDSSDRPSRTSDRM